MREMMRSKSPQKRQVNADGPVHKDDKAADPFGRDHEWFRETYRPPGSGDTEQGGTNGGKGAKPPRGHTYEQEFPREEVSRMRQLLQRRRAAAEKKREQRALEQAQPRKPLSIDSSDIEIIDKECEKEGYNELPAATKPKRAQQEVERSSSSSLGSAPDPRAARAGGSGDEAEDDPFADDGGARDSDGKAVDPREARAGEPDDYDDSSAGPTNE